MKRLAMLVLTCTLTLGVPVVTYATSLDDVISQSVDTSDNSSVSNDSSSSSIQSSSTYSTTTSGSVQTSGESDMNFSDILKGAGKLDTTSPTAVSVNSGIKKVASLIVQILSYFIVAGLVVRVVVDICYICIPFSRSFLSNGYSGNAQAGGAGSGMPGGMGMGGMSGGFGGGGFGGGGFGQSGGFGGGGFGAPAPMGGGASPATGRTQWVSEAALNAVAAGKSVDQNNKPVSPLKAYAKDMVPTLVITPILLVLAMTGVLSDLGFLIGDVIASAIGGISGML
jgi:hypothetical protein